MWGCLVFPDLGAVQGDPKAGIVKGGHFAHFQSRAEVGASFLRAAVGFAVVLDQAGSDLVKVDVDLHGAPGAMVGVCNLGCDGFHLFVPFACCDASSNALLAGEAKSISIIF